MGEHIRRGEDQLLWTYWHERGGRLWQEVPIPVAGPGKTRRVDAVIADVGEARSRPSGPVDWTAQHLEVVEVKAVLNEEVIGQAAAARVEAAVRGNRDVKTVEAVALVGEAGDEDLLYVCKSLNVRVEVALHCVVLSIPFSPDDKMLVDLQQYADERGLEDRSDALRVIVEEWSIARAAELGPS